MQPKEDKRIYIGYRASRTIGFDTIPFWPVAFVWLGERSLQSVEPNAEFSVAVFAIAVWSAGSKPVAHGGKFRSALADRNTGRLRSRVTVIRKRSFTVVCKSVAKIKLSEPRTHNIDFW